MAKALRWVLSVRARSSGRDDRRYPRPGRQRGRRGDEQRPSSGCYAEANNIRALTIQLTRCFRSASRRRSQHHQRVAQGTDPGRAAAQACAMRKAAGPQSADARQMAAACIRPAYHGHQPPPAQRRDSPQDSRADPAGAITIVRRVFHAVYTPHLQDGA